VNSDRGESRVVRKEWRRHLLRSLLVTLLFLGSGAGFLACHSRKPEQSPRYHLTGKIADVDKADKYILVDQDDIPGFMPAMTMSYPVKDPRTLNSLSPGDRITADVVMGNDGARLENIAIVKKGSGEAPKPSS
jgi:Cu/Ag efflux protein CusF